jgi:hypothetical protein
MSNIYPYVLRNPDPRHPYQKGSGRRAAAMNYLVGCGMDPTSIAAQLCALSAIVTQPLANVCWPNGQPSVIGNSTLLVDQSAGGKSAGAKFILTPVSEYLSTLDLPGLEEPISLIEDATREAVIDALVASHSVALVTSEGGMVPPLMRSGGPWLPKLVDGEGLRHSRRSLAGRIAISSDRRFTMQVAIQPGPSLEMSDLIRSARGETGLQNRFNLFVVKSWATDNVLHHVNPNAPATRALAVRSMELINETVSMMRSKRVRPNLRLAKDAAEFLIHIDQEARGIARMQTASYLRGYLLRHAERVLRDAGSDHVYEYGPEGEIALPTVQIADQLGRESFRDFELFTYRAPTPTKQEINAGKVEELLRRCRGATLSLAKVRGLAPNVGLTRGQFDSALPLVCAQGKARVDGDVLQVNLWALGGPQSWPSIGQ